MSDTALTETRLAGGRPSRAPALAAAAALAAALAAEIAVFGVTLTPDRYLLALLAPALVLRRARRYVVDFLPFAVLLLLYEECRGIAHLLHPVPFYRPQLAAEQFLFAGHIPSHVLQGWLWSGTARWYDHAAVAVTRVHFIAPPTLAFALWLGRRALFYRFAATMLLVSYAGALTFVLFPAAPPWAASRAGMIEPVARLTSERAVPTSLPHGVGPIYRLVNGNPYAAVPSLHGAYALLVCLFLVSVAWRTRFRWYAVTAGLLYTAVQSFAVVYTGNHYVIDLLVGFAYTAGGFLAVRALWRRKGWT